ncbi:MAG: hypothetical protein DME24_12930 [Verrucomicrobia bacterium]|nr:MAG: hypothetical protein DME24_12930 [Verrucomicrobiota bacterium]
MFESEPMAERQVAGDFMAGTLVSLRGQAALGNRFPKRFGNDLPAHFPTEAHPLESPAVAGPLPRSRRARAGGSSARCRVRASQVFPFCF